MSANKRIVMDTSAFCALISSADIFHTQAKSSYKRLLDWEWEMWTTSYILIETSNLIHLRLGFEPLKPFLETIFRFTQILWIEESILSEAWKRMKERHGQEYSLIDWTTIIAAEKLRASLFTFQDNFRKEGIRIFPRRRS